MQKNFEFINHFDIEVITWSR